MPLSGYDLTRYMKRPIGFFWSAHQSQIYPELTRLEAQGLITSQMVEQRTRPDKKLYTITDAGLAALRHWVTEPVEVPPERSELVLKAYSAWLADPEEAIRLFRAHEEYHLARLRQYEQILAQLEQKHSPVWRVDEPKFGDYATLQRGIGNQREYAAWCRWMAEQFEKHLNHPE